MLNTHLRTERVSIGSHWGRGGGHPWWTKTVPGPDRHRPRASACLEPGRRRLARRPGMPGISGGPTAQLGTL